MVNELDTPAFPSPTDKYIKGLTKREYIAVEVLKSMLANPTLKYGDEFQPICHKALFCADIMLKELAENPNTIYNPKFSDFRPIN